MAQNTWEMPEQEEVQKANPDQKYLAGAVPVVDGRVVFKASIPAPGKTAEQVYRTVLGYFSKMVKEPNQLEPSRVAVADSTGHNICATIQEWLVFTDKALVLDRTRFMYTLIANCSDGKADVQLSRIYYLYDEERNPQQIKAEEWITDEYGLKKNKQALSRITGKFRRKTIDRANYIFGKLATLLK